MRERPETVRGPRYYDQHQRYQVLQGPWGYGDALQEGMVHVDVFVDGSRYEKCGDQRWGSVLPNGDRLRPDEEITLDPRTGSHPIKRDPDRGNMTIRGGEGWRVRGRCDGHSEGIRYSVLFGGDDKGVKVAFRAAVEKLRGVIRRRKGAKRKPIPIYEKDEERRSANGTAHENAATLKIACVKGRHRSVVLARLLKRLANRYGCTCQIHFLNLYEGAPWTKCGDQCGRPPCGCHLGTSWCMHKKRNRGRFGEAAWRAFLPRLKAINNDKEMGLIGDIVAKYDEEKLDGTFVKAADLNKHAGKFYSPPNRIGWGVNHHEWKACGVKPDPAMAGAADTSQRAGTKGGGETGRGEKRSVDELVSPKKMPRPKPASMPGEKKKPEKRCVDSEEKPASLKQMSKPKPDGAMAGSADTSRRGGTEAGETCRGAKRSVDMPASPKKRPKPKPESMPLEKKTPEVGREGAASVLSHQGKGGPDANVQQPPSVPLSDQLDSRAECLAVLASAASTRSKIYEGRPVGVEVQENDDGRPAREQSPTKSWQAKAVAVRSHQVNKTDQGSLEANVQHSPAGPLSELPVPRAECSVPPPSLASAASTCSKINEGWPAGFAVGSSAATCASLARPPSAPSVQLVVPYGEPDKQEAGRAVLESQQKYEDRKRNFEGDLCGSTGAVASGPSPKVGRLSENVRYGAFIMRERRHIALSRCRSRSWIAHG